MSRFNVSDRVVCIRDDFPPGDEFLFSPCLPRRGQIYVVREYRITRGIPGVLLVGIDGQLCPGYRCEFGFKADRFRRIEEVEDGLELACEMAV